MRLLPSVFGRPPIRRPESGDDREEAREGNRPVRRRFRRRHAARRRPLHRRHRAVGNDLSTLPDFPAEIRAPAGTPHGVSAFQIHFASRDILTPGDHPNTLVAMNPAALKANLAALEAGGTVIVNEDAFTDNNLRKAGYEENPLDDGTLDDYQLFRVPMTSMTTRATEEIEGLKPAEAPADQEHLRPRPALLDLRAADRGVDLLAGDEIREKAGDHGGEHRRLQSGLQLRRDRGARGHPDRNRAGAARPRRVPQRRRHQRRSRWA